MPTQASCGPASREAGRRNFWMPLFVGAALAVSASGAAQPWGMSDGPNGKSRDPVIDSRANFGAVGFPEYPSLSPDGQFVAFTWAGDIWSSPVKGGVATRLTAHPADDRRSAFSPDGKLLAFESNREGARNLYIMPLIRSGDRLAAGDAVRVTTSDQTQGLGTFTADGHALLFASNKEPAVYRSPRLFRVELRLGPDGAVVGGGPVSRMCDAFGSGPRAASDGKSILFVRGYAGLERPRYRGSGNTDVYSFDPAAKTFTRFTDDLGTDTDPWGLPDGSVLFISSRDGQNNVWRASRPGAGAAANFTQLTHFAPSAEQVTIAHGVRDLAVSADGRVAVFAVWDTLYRLDLTDRPAKPEPITLRADGDNATLDFQRLNLDKEISEQAISPDGKTLAVVARGEIFIRNTQEGYPTRRVTDTPGRERDIAWSPDGKLLYFASDDTGDQRTDSTRGIYGLYAASVELAREDILPEKKKAADKKEDPGPEEPAKADQPAPAPDASEPAADKKPDEPKADDKPKDKKDAKPDYGKRWSEALRFHIEPVVAPGDFDVRSPVPSPDGKKLLFTRNRGDLVLRDLADKSERVLVNSWEDTEPLWASDSRHVIYAVSDLDFNSDIWLLDTASPEGPAPQASDRDWPNPVNLTRHPDEDRSPRLSADGKVLTFLSERAGENGDLDVYQIYLDRALDDMTAYERDDYFKKAAEAAGKRKPLGAADKDAKPAGKDAKKDDADKKDDAAKPPEPLTFDAADAYLRVRRLTSLPGPETSLAVTPGADRIIFAASLDGDRALVSVDHKGGDRKTLQAGGGTSVAVSLTGDKVSYVRTGQVYVTPKTGGKSDALPIDAPVVIDIAAQQRQKFLEAAKALGTQFYHPTLKGLDWPGLTRRYLALAVSTRTNESFNRITQMLFGELEGSHTGIRGGAGYTAPSPATGYLGVFAEPAPGGFRITRVCRETPADAKPNPLQVGDLILAIDGLRLAPDDTSSPTLDLDAALAGRAGKETLVEVRRASPVPGAPATQLLLMVPMNFGAWDVAEYWDEVSRRQKLVDELSAGKLGYLHIRAMGEESVRDFERDLYAAANGKQGLIIDVRDNGGGSTADILLSSLTAPVHAYTIPRGADPATVPHDAYPRDRRLIYAWTRPINVLINENSFSNAEIFAHAIKTIGRGKLVGTATFGGVISTGGMSLIDGTFVRLPFRGWYMPDGTDMENHGAEPDVAVPQTPDDEAAGRDRQLEAAVQELLGRVNGK